MFFSWASCLVKPTLLHALLFHSGCKHMHKLWVLATYEEVLLHLFRDAQGHFLLAFSICHVQQFESCKNVYIGLFPTYSAEWEASLYLKCISREEKNQIGCLITLELMLTTVAFGLRDRQHMARRCNMLFFKVWPQSAAQISVRYPDVLCRTQGEGGIL